MFRIATRYGITGEALAQANGITNANLIYAGQELCIPAEGQQAPTPAATAEPTAAPTAVPPPASTTTYTIQIGDSLASIAIRYGVTVTALMEANNIANPNVIYYGQTLTIPGTDGSTPAPAETQAPEAPESQTLENAGFDFGIQVFLSGANDSVLVDQAQSLGMNWIKYEVSWRDLEVVEGTIDFAQLDNAIALFADRGLSILLTVTDAPDWARTSTEESGPPDELADYATFVGAVAARYAGRVAAYEVWDEPNLRREWNSTVHNISAASYIELLRLAHDAIKAADPNAVIVSAGLAPTGFNDGVNAISDRVFLNGLYAAGLANYSDAVGAHPGGWANPPDTRCCEQPVGVTTHYEDRSFYFLENLTDYRAIQVDNNDAGTAIWVTKFGWGTSEDTAAPSSINVFVTYTSLGEQAIYDPRGFELGREGGYIGPMFLYNLNGCGVQLDGPEGCYSSLLATDGSQRPVFAAIQALDKTAPTPTPEPTIEPTTAPQVVEPTVAAPTATVEVPTLPPPNPAPELVET
ncbi:MAG: LysM peptidoglycan-binding domain-containing protein, partial [Burkholderiales bacterium]|nr:LysM peptidoglycan-binding domain-containing protein [Anaerolineae bacterium]